MAVVLVLVPVPVAVELYAVVPLHDLRVVCGKLGGRVLLLSWPLLLFRPTADAATVGGIVRVAEERRRIGDTGRPEAVHGPTDPNKRPSTLWVEAHRGLWR